MKIIISPSKTKKIGVLDGVDSFETPIFSKITDKIITEVASWPVEDIEVKFKLKSEQAKKLSDFYIKKYMQMNSIGKNRSLWKKI